MPLMSTSKESPELTGLVPLFLKKGSERRLRNGHPWVFSNETQSSARAGPGFGSRSSS
jgi:hypothetical protein